MNNIPIASIICEAPMTAEDSRIISQSADRVIAEGTLQEGNEKNRNNRGYATKELAGQIAAPRTLELLKTGNMKGEAGHPTDKDLMRQQTILPTLVQVKYLKFWMDGNKVKAQYMGTNNALGEEFNKDLLCGELPSFSLRALGMIENVNGMAWVKNLRLITYDRVYYPSHPGAYTERLVTEAATESNVSENKILVPYGYKGQIVPVTNQSVIDYIKHESCNLNTIMNNFDSVYNSIELLENGDVRLTTSDNDIIQIRVEKHIKNEIMDYCYRK